MPPKTSDVTEYVVPDPDVTELCPNGTPQILLAHEKMSLHESWAAIIREKANALFAEHHGSLSPVRVEGGRRMVFFLEEDGVALKFTKAPLSPDAALRLKKRKAEYDPQLLEHFHGHVVGEHHVLFPIATEQMGNVGTIMDVQRLRDIDETSPDLQIICYGCAEKLPAPPDDGVIPDGIVQLARERYIRVHEHLFLKNQTTYSLQDVLQTQHSDHLYRIFDRLTTDPDYREEYGQLIRTAANFSAKTDETLDLMGDSNGELRREQGQWKYTLSAGVMPPGPPRLLQVTREILERVSVKGQAAIRTGNPYDPIDIGDRSIVCTGLGYARWLQASAEFLEIPNVHVNVVPQNAITVDFGMWFDVLHAGFQAKRIPASSR